MCMMPWNKRVSALKYEIKNKVEFQGANSCVFNAKYDNNNVIVKFIKGNGWKTELEITKLIKHKNLINCISVNEKEKCIIMEKCKYGDLIDVINNESLTEIQIRNVFIQIVKAIEYLHLKCNVIHGDLKAEHILFKTPTEICVIDFGSAFYNKKELFYKQIGSPGNQPPEVLRGLGYSSQIDTWGLGIILFEMIYKYNPFDKQYINKSKSLKKNGCNVFFPYGEVSDSLIDLISQLLQQSPENRPIISNVLKHHWITQTGK